MEVCSFKVRNGVINYYFVYVAMIVESIDDVFCTTYNIGSLLSCSCFFWGLHVSVSLRSMFKDTVADLHIRIGVSEYRRHLVPSTFVCISYSPT